MTGIMVYPESDLRKVTKTVAFDGTAGNGAVGTVDLFTVSGRVTVESITAFCTEDLTEAGATATVAVGATGNTACLIEQANATTIDANEWWNSGVEAPVAGGMAKGPVLVGGGYHPVAISANVILTVGAQNVTNGTIVFTIRYRPETDGATLTAA